MRQWRLIYDPPTHGALNMAVDEAIARAVAAHQQPPTLRLYAWEPACLSLGYGQRAADADWERLASQGWTAVRRTTGGRAILHVDECTYSVSLPLDHPLAQGDLIESYREISRALLAALQYLGAEPNADRQVGGVKSFDPVCFETPSDYEITVDGRKLVGSAQARRGGSLLQHGTLPLEGDIGRICDALVYADEEARTAAKAHVHTRATTLEEALGRRVAWDTAARAIEEGFRETFGLEWMPGRLSAAEEAEAVRLAQERYGTNEWTIRR